MVERGAELRQFLLLLRHARKGEERVQESLVSLLSPLPSLSWQGWEEDAFSSPLLSQLAGEKQAGSRDVSPPYPEAKSPPELLGEGSSAADLGPER